MCGSWWGMSPDATRLKKSSTLEFRPVSPSCIRRAVSPVDESFLNMLARLRALPENGLCKVRKENDKE